MRAFSCFITDSRHSVPTLSFIFASDLGRARELARRELLESPHAVSYELCENGRLLVTEYGRPVAPARTKAPSLRWRMAPRMALRAAR